MKAYNNKKNYNSRINNIHLENNIKNNKNKKKKYKN